MKSFALNLIVLLIALFAFDFHFTPSTSQTPQNHQLTKVPVLDVDPLSNPSVREHQKHQNYIADPFIPIVVLAHSLYEDRDFSFYLPVYELHHRERYFLLI